MAPSKRGRRPRGVCTATTRPDDGGAGSGATAVGPIVARVRFRAGFRVERAEPAAPLDRVRGAVLAPWRVGAGLGHAARPALPGGLTARAPCVN